MEYKTRSYPLFSVCGLNCGLCPRYFTSGTSRCPGCAGDGFSKVHPSCGILSCCQRKDLEYCFECYEYPCKKYDGADLTDSFITHKNQILDLDKAKQNGMENYEAELNEKTTLLKELIEKYDDGRRKSFFCIAVNLLDLPDIKKAMTQITTQLNVETSTKEKAAATVRAFEEIAEQRGISLKLRKKVTTR